jgi:CRISPR-associated protein Csd1
MILHALHDYYQRRQADPDPARRLPAFGREHKEIGFILELDTEGGLVAISDVRTLDDKKRKVGTRHLVPKGVKKTSGVAANLLWDNAEYVLQVPDAKKLAAATEKGKADDYMARLVEMKAAFKARVQALPAPVLADAGIQAVLAFLSGDTVTAAGRFEAFAELASSNAVLSFRLVGDEALVCQRPAVSPFLVEADDDADGEAPADSSTAPCLITGQQAPVARLHTAIKGVWGAQSSGANIVSFNLDAFNSFGKAQGANAPVSQAAAFAYTTALNALLVKGSNQRLQVGDSSTVFWAQRPDPVEDWLAEIIGGDDPDAHVQQVKALFEAVHRGGFDGGRGENRFYMLGLAPNAARIAIRFWHQAPLADLAQQIVAWFDDLRIARAPHDPEFPSLFRLLSAIALQGKADNIPPKLAGDIARAILTGGPFPVTWLNAAVQRCRAEQQVTHLRAAGLKACLNRSIRAQRSPEEEFTAMLDVANPSPAYRLGRLFAVLEKIQEESSGGRLNSTIRDRYYGAASSTPASVLPLLLKLKNHHVGKLDERGRAMLYRAFQDHQPDDYIGQILWGLGDVPRQLGLPEQGRFALGYYHQRQAFFTKADAAPTSAKTTETIQEGH